MSNAAFNLLWKVRQLREAQEIVTRRAGMTCAKVDQLLADVLMENLRERAAAIIAA